MFKSSIGFLIFIIMTITSYAQDYLKIDIAPSCTTITENDTVTFKISLTPLNGFNATVELSADKGILSQTNINPPIDGKTSYLTIYPNDVKAGINLFTVTGKNGVTFLDAEVCTASVEEMLDISPRTSIEKIYRDTAEFKLKLTNLAKTTLINGGDEHLLVSTNRGIVVPETLNYTIEDEVRLRIPAVSDYSISNIRLEGNKSGTIFNARCTATVEYEWNVYTSGNSGLLGNEVNVMAVDNRGDLWFASENRGVATFDGNSWKSYDTSNSGLPSNKIYAISSDNSGAIWFGTKKGLVKYDHQFWTVYNKTNSELPDNQVLNVSVDDNGAVWVGTYRQLGVIKFDGTKWTIFNENNSILPSNKIRSIFAKDNENKWVGTTDGLAKFDDNKWTVHTTANSGLSYDYVNSIAKDNLGNMWFGLGQYGNPIIELNKFDGENWELYKDTCMKYLIFSLSIDSANNKWIVTNDGGFDKSNVIKFDGENWTVFTRDNSGITNPNIFEVITDKNGFIWVGTRGGVAKYSAKKIPTNIFSGKTKKTLNLDFEISSKGVTYSIFQDSNIKISVYAINGKIIKSINKWQKAGIHSTNWNLSNLASGIYLVKIETGFQVGCKKLVLSN